jgi:hypothetical protein
LLSPLLLSWQVGEVEAGVGPHLPLAQQPGEVAGVAAHPLPPRQWLAAQEVVVVAAGPQQLLPQPAQLLQGQAVLVVVAAGPQPVASLLQAAPGLVLEPLPLLVSLLQLLVHWSQLASHPQQLAQLLLASLLLQGARVAVVVAPQRSPLALCQQQQEGPQASVLLLLQASVLLLLPLLLGCRCSAAQQQGWAPAQQGLRLARLQLLLGWQQ